MRTFVFVIALVPLACVTTGSVEDAQMAALRCHQKLRAAKAADDPDEAATLERCEELDLRAEQMEKRHDRQQEGFKQMAKSNQHHRVQCTSTTSGNTTDTECED